MSSLRRIICHLSAISYELLCTGVIIVVMSFLLYMVLECRECDEEDEVK